MTAPGRGALTPEIQNVANLHLGRDITRTELRLMPYIQYVMVNDQKLDPRKVNGEERQILRRWKDEGYIEGGACGLAITREFWDAIHAILWFGYVIGAANHLPEQNIEAYE